MYRMCCSGTNLLLCLRYKSLDELFHSSCISKAVVYYRSSFSDQVIAFFLPGDALFILAGHRVDVSSMITINFGLLETLAIRYVRIVMDLYCVMIPCQDVRMIHE